MNHHQPQTTSVYCQLVTKTKLCEIHYINLNLHINLHLTHYIWKLSITRLLCIGVKGLGKDFKLKNIKIVKFKEELGELQVKPYLYKGKIFGTRKRDQVKLHRIRKP